MSAGIFAAAMVAGCVTTAECDDYVGCPEETVCYQSRCLPECSEDTDCREDRVCRPCYRQDDDPSGPGRCFGEEASVCVSDDEE